MIIRFAAGIMTVMVGAFCGVNYSEKLKRRMTFCLEAEKMMRMSEILIRSCGTDVYSIVGRLKRESYSELAFLDMLPEYYDAEQSFREQWSTALSAARNVSDEEKRLLIDFGNHLGSTDTEGQLSGIALQIELMHGQYEKRRSEYCQKGRLYRSIGMLAGLTAGIMVI